MPIIKPTYSNLRINLERSTGLLVPMISVMAAFAVGGIFILIWGSNPVKAYGALVSGAFGSPNALAATLMRMTPLIFTGLAVSFGYRSGFFNIGAEGQLYMAAMSVTWISVTFPDIPGILMVPICLLSAMVSGAAWAFLPGLLKASRGLNEVLTTLLMNYIAIQIFEWSIRVDHLSPYIQQSTFGLNWLGLKDASQPFPKSSMIPEAAQIGSLQDFFRSTMLSDLLGPFDFYQRITQIPAYDRFSFTSLLAILAGVIVYILMFKTTLGFRCRAVGVNPAASRYLGIDVVQTTIFTSLISGSLAGLAGAVEVMGTQYRLIPNFLVNAGFDGIPVALIGQIHPFGVFFSSLFFGALRAGANKMQIIAQVPAALIYVIQAIAILFAVAGTVINLKPAFFQHKNNSPSSSTSTTEISNG